jgi:hypothetical protein
MITNIGKNIVAKYLIGDAPAYASFMALGCGQKPRNTVNTLSGVNTTTYSGTISVAATTGLIIGMASVEGLVPGMTLEKLSGVGAFGGVSQVATVVSVNSSSSITISTTATSTLGDIVFYPFGVSSVLTVSDSSSLWKGARLTQVSSLGGLLNPSEVTVVDKILSSTKITISPGPVTGRIQNALLSIGSDPRIKSLEFESLRVPITSRGYVNDAGTNKIILTAQLPSEERYEFTEIGIYSAGANRSAGAYDSKVISAFSATEGWELSANNTVSGPSTTNPIFQEFEVSIIDSNNTITSEAPAIQIRSSNGIFANQDRVSRYEKTRFLENVFLIKGDNSFIYDDKELITVGIGARRLEIDSNPKFLQLSSNIIDLSKNSSSDVLKLAFSIVSVDGDASTIVPTDTFVVAEFSNNDGSQFARMQVQINENDYDLANNRYIVVTKKLEELYYTNGFSWKTANTIKVYVSTTRDLLVSNKQATSNVARLTTTTSHNLDIGDRVFISNVSAEDQEFDGVVTVTGVPTGTTFEYAYQSATNVTGQEVNPRGTAKTVDGRFYVALDGIRLENINTVNPLYGLVGYSIIQNETEASIVKSPNTTNFIEYRFVLDVT